MHRLVFLLALLLPASVHAQDASAIESFVEAYHEADRFSGAVLVADGGEVLYAGGHGLANVAWGVPNTPETRFRIGSVTKQFTAALVLQLMEEGLVDLEAPVTAYVPAYPAEPGDRVTVHQLLVHTSGIPSYTSLPEFFPDLSRDPYAPDSFLTVFQDLPLDFEPGEQWSYNNSGYFLLGVLIEKVTGQSFADALRDRLLTPLGLDDTDYEESGVVYPRAASGYVREGSRLARAAYLDPSLPYAAGMMISTVGDLQAWSEALAEGHVFERPETLELMNTAHVDVGGGGGAYGYGVFVDEAQVGGETVAIVEHGGGINGFSTGFRLLPDRDAVIVTMSNTSDPARGLVDGIMRLLYGEAVEAPTPSAAGPVADAFAEGGPEAAVAAFEAARASGDYEVDENILNDLGYDRLGDGDVEGALVLFRANVAAFPDAWNPHDSLGEALREAGDTEASIASYQRALDLNPGAASARTALEEMGATVETLAVSETVLERYVGRYEIQPGFVIEVTREGGELFGQATGQSRFRLVPSSETEFAVEGVDARVAFEAGDPAPALTLFQSGAQIRAPRVEG